MALSTLTTPTAAVMAFALSYAGMAGLCLAMDRHHAQVWKRDASASTRWGLRTGGLLLLALAIVPSVAAWGATVGVVVWLGFLSAGALLLAGLLPYAPRAASVLAGVFTVGGSAWLALQFLAAAPG